MSNWRKDKGTWWERTVKEALQEHGFTDAERSPAGKKSWDILGVPSNHGSKLHDKWVIECKFALKPRFFDWIPNARTADPVKVSVDGVEEVDQNEHWVIFWRHGDTRTANGKLVREVAVLDKDVFLKMLEVYELHYHDFMEEAERAEEFRQDRVHLEERRES